MEACQTGVFVQTLYTKNGRDIKTEVREKFSDQGTET